MNYMKKKLIIYFSQLNDLLVIKYRIVLGIIDKSVNFPMIDFFR